MIKKIISGGQTGADRAALDFAIDNEIPHGGWAPRGRLAEDGIIPESYNLCETDATGYNDRTEKNVVDSDGTLILSHGPLTGGSALTQALARRHGRPFLHMDLSKVSEFEAAVETMHWVNQHGIETLNVAGSRFSKDPQIYSATINILETVFYVGIIDENMPDFINKPYEINEREAGLKSFQTVDEILESLMDEISLKDKVAFAGLREYELVDQYESLGLYIRNYYGISSGNERLLQSCRDLSGRADMDVEDAVMFIIRKLWEKVKLTHAIRRVK